MEKSPLIMAASLVDMMKNVTGKMRILNSLRTDVTVYQGTVIGTAVATLALPLLILGLGSGLCVGVFIVTSNSTVPVVFCFSVPLALADEEKLTIEQMERQGIIRKSLSPWASPIVLVRKKNGKVDLPSLAFI
jgi:uncharacterized metal-binding protein